MKILGISAFYHDSAAAIIIDGKVVAASQEERFTRKKHDSGFPKNASEYCLEKANLNIEDIDYVAFYEKPLIKFERLLTQYVETYPKGWLTFVNSMPGWINQKLRIKRELKKNINYNGEVIFVEHHMSHASAAFLCSPFDEAAILTVDGVGEWSTTTWGVGKGNNIELKQEVTFPHSIGLLYSTITAYLGFKVNNSEYKVMGLSPYGKPRYLKEFNKMVKVNNDGSVWMNTKYFKYHYGRTMFTKELENLLGPARKPDGPLLIKHKDIAASLQKFIEDTLFKMLNYVQKNTGSENLCMAGGVALNSVANGKILRNTNFKNIYIQPAAGDSGSAIGAALYAYNTIFDNKRDFIMRDCYLGESYSDKEIESFLKKNKIKYKKFKDRDEKIELTAKLLKEKNVIGWFHKGMEWGPRALGARSILADPQGIDMRDILNAKVKHREAFRPFAPVVPADDAHKYFDCDEPVPIPTDFMLMVYPVKKEFHERLPAITHVDGSGRLQTIRREQNADYYDLLKEYGKISGIPILVNTSFNIRGEPIVMSPFQAYRCMMGTEIDYLVLENYLVKRSENPKDIWDSEKYAKD